MALVVKNSKINSGSKKVRLNFNFDRLASGCSELSTGSVSFRSIRRPHNLMQSSWFNSHERDNILAFLAKAGGEVAQRLQYALETPAMEG